ncbi:unnamed protein product [Ophioblennius macclurei]
MDQRRGSLRILLLILSALPGCMAVKVSIQQEDYEVARGRDIVMTCSFTPARPDPTPYVLTWEAWPDADGEPMKKVATVFKDLHADIAPAYEGRASMEMDATQRTSTLTLYRVELEDSRSYQCSVTIPNDDEGTPAATTSLLVLVAPSTPICDIQGTAEYFHDIKLTCESEEGSPLPTYDWKSFSVENNPRPLPPKSVQTEGALSLVNISMETSGLFTCTSSNRVGSKTCDVSLAVMPPSSNTGTIIGIVVGVIAGIILIGVIVSCVLRKRQKKKARKQGPPAEMEFQDNVDPKGGETYWDDKKHDKKYTDKNAAPQKKGTAGKKVDDEHLTDNSDPDCRDGKDQRRGSRDRLEDQRDQYRGSRDRLDDQRDQYRGSRDRLDDQRDQYRGSRDRLDDRREPYSRDQYRSSRDRLDDNDHYSRGRDTHTDYYQSSRDNYGSGGGGGGGHHSSSHGYSDYD